MGNLVGKPLVYVNKVTSIDASEENQGLRWGKFEYAQGITNRLSNDFPLLRYADVCLMKAEALLRTGHTDEAAELVTLVRERNFRSHPEKAVVTGSQLTGNSCYDYGRRDNRHTRQCRHPVWQNARRTGLGILTGRTPPARHGPLRGLHHTGMVLTRCQ